MPELAAIFLAGSILSFLSGLAFSYFQLSRYRSGKYTTLQKNLAQIDLRWNDLEGSVGELTKGDTRREYERARTTYILFTAVAVLFSWLGFVFLMLMWFSVRKLVRPRLEKEIFHSPLVQQELQREMVVQQWDVLKTYE